MTNVKRALGKLEEIGMNLNEDKAIFNLEDGTLEIYIDHDEETLKVEMHDLKTYVSDELKEKSMMEIMGEIHGINEEEL